MPIFDKNRIVVTCDFDDNIVVVGGSISGTVNIFVHEPVTLCGASLRYHVDESFTVHTQDNRSIPNLDKTSFNIEYVLFGERNTKKSSPIHVKPGHYKYPFSIPVASSAPPSSTFGSRKGLKILNNGAVMSVAVDHRIDVNVYIAKSLMDKQTTYTVPMVVKAVPPSLLASSTNGREGHLRKGMSTTLSTKGSFLRTIFSGFAGPTKEQGDCDLFVYNTAISLAETPFLHFAIRGTINCPYHIALVRQTSYGMGAHKHITEEVVSGMTMPPLESPENGLRGKLIISPHALQSSTSFKGKFVSCEFFVTLKLIYASGVDAGIKLENRVKIPIDVSHGSLVSEAVPGVVAATIADGAVMSYSCPEGHGGEFLPVGPVTEEHVAPAAWGGKTELRYNRQIPAPGAQESSVSKNGNHYVGLNDNKAAGFGSSAYAGPPSSASNAEIDTPHFVTPGVTYYTTSAADNDDVSRMPTNITVSTDSANSHVDAGAFPTSTMAIPTPPNGPREASFVAGSSSASPRSTAMHNPHSQVGQSQQYTHSAVPPQFRPLQPSPYYHQHNGDRPSVYDGIQAVSNANGPVFDENGHPVNAYGDSKVKTSAPLPPVSA